VPGHDFEAVGKSCLVIGGIFVLLGLSGMAGDDASGSLRELESLGVALPSWFPMALFDHYRMLCAVQLPPNLLMAVVGWGLLKKQPWSLGGLKVTAWVFLLGSVALGTWILSATGPVAATADPAEQAMRTIFVWTMGTTTAVMVASVAWFLWRLRGARFA
jgi:hypothetical protein